MRVRTPAVLDTSFWIHAFAVGLLQHVLRLFTVHYTPEVAAELPEHFASGREFRRLMRTGELEEIRPRRDHIGMFGLGERSAINIALEHRDWALLLDDARPFVYAAGIGLRTVSSPRFVTLLYDGGGISRTAAGQFLNQLSGQGTVSPALIGLAMSLLPEK